jgi:hypothetical protein
MPSPEDCATLKAFFESADNTRIAVERRWGCGRLEMLADPLLLARFRRQQATWREALAAAWALDPVPLDALSLVDQKTASMVRAWSALEAAAVEAGHREVAPWVWEVRLKDGTVAAFVQTGEEVARVIADGRYMRVYSVAEVGVLLDSMPEAFRPVALDLPGRRFVSSLPRTSTDEIPFDDPIPFGLEAVA